MITEQCVAKSDRAELWLTYDTADGNFDPDLEAFAVVAHAPTVVRVVWQSSGRVWKTIRLDAGERYEQSAPFGRFRKKESVRFEIGGGG